MEMEFDDANLLIKSASIEEVYDNIDILIKKGYTMEQCIKEVLSYIYYNTRVFKPFIKYVILNGDKPMKDCLLSNLDPEVDFSAIEEEYFQKYMKDNFEDAFPKLSFNMRERYIGMLLKDNNNIQYI